MEWRQQTRVSCADAFIEAQRWIEEVTGKSFGCNDFRAALENGVLLCDLINQLKPGIIKRVNRLSTPIAGLDNVSVFLKACGKLGLNVSQLFHPGDLQDLSTRATLRRDESNRRLKNVLITIYWLGRKANLDAFYTGPQLNFKAFEGLLGLALSKALDEGSNVIAKDGGYRDSRSPEREETLHMKPSYKTQNSADSSDSPALPPNGEGCGSDAEAEQVFKMETTQAPTHQHRGYVPPPLLRRKQGREDNGQAPLSPLASDVLDHRPQPRVNRQGCTTLCCSGEDASLSAQPITVSPPDCTFDEELFLQALCEEDSEDDYPEPDPVLDDLYFRRVQHTLHQTSSNPSYDRFLPQYWTPEEEVRVRTIYLGSQRRPWYHAMQGLRTYQIQVRHERPFQVNPGWIWSKSLSDIPMVYPVRKVSDGNVLDDAGQERDWTQQWSQDNKRKCSVAAKDSEAQWQDDFTKWKNRRRSTKSDQRRMSQDREHVINQMINGALTNYEKNETGKVLKRDQQSPRRSHPAHRPYSTSPSKPSTTDLRPHTRALLTRSYATEVPFRPTAAPGPHSSAHAQGNSFGAMPAFDGSSLGGESHFASLASDGARVTTPSQDCPFSSQTHVQTQGSQAPMKPPSEMVQHETLLPNQISTLVTTLKPVKTVKSAGTRGVCPTMSSHVECPVSADPPFCPGAVNQVGVEALSENQKTSWEPAVEQRRGQQAAASFKYSTQGGSWSGSATLPRGYRRSEGSARLSTAITARPFGSKQSRVSSLPRLYNVDNNQGELLKSEKGPSHSPPTDSSLKRQTASTHLKGQRETRANQAKHSEAQVAEVKGATLSSQTSFQTNGYHNQPPASSYILPQPYSNLQAPHNKTTLTSIGSVDRPKVDHSDMRVSLTLKPSSRPDFGFQTHWDTTGVRVKFIQPGSPAELCQLCVDDEIVAVNGVPVAHMNYTQWKDKMTSSLKAGGLTMDIRRYGNKDWSASEGRHHNQPGPGRVTLNLTAAAPVLIGYPNHHANSGAWTGSTVRRTSKFNGQTDNVIQSKVMHGEFADNHRTARIKEYGKISRKNQRRRAEFFRQKGGSESAISDLQVPSLNPSAGSWSWDHEEDRRRQEKWQEEQERLLQEQCQRDQQRLKAEWQRAQQDAMGEQTKTENNLMMTNGGDGLSCAELHVTVMSSETREEEVKEAGAKPQSPPQGETSDKITEHSWADDSCGFAQLSPAHRAKSLSTPALGPPHKHTKGDEGKRKGAAVSKVEQERQQILEEMKKRTQLLTDNSWIRQRSSSFYRERVYVGAPLKRFESLDNLDTLRQSRLSSGPLGYPRPHSAAAGFCAPSRNSCSRYSCGASLSQKNSSLDASRHSSVWAASDISEELSLGSGFESEMGRRTASPAISNSSPLVCPPCDQYAVLHITE